MQLHSSFFSIAGIGKVNEDSWESCVLNNGTQVFIIADGVGGNYGGSIASALAVKVAKDTLEKNSNISMEELFLTISKSMQSRAEEDLITGQMATTLSLCVINPNGVVRLGHVGDSRIYHLRENGIVQRTKDQTEVAALVEAGILTREQAKTYPRRTVLSSALTTKGNYEIYGSTFTLLPGDRVVMVTDGTYRLITKTHLRNLSKIALTVEDLTQALVKEISNKNDDDATCLIIEVLS